MIDRAWLAEEIERAEEEARESSKAAMNSYGAGYDSGYLAALKAVREHSAPAGSQDPSA